MGYSRGDRRGDDRRDDGRAGERSGADRSARGGSDDRSGRSGDRGRGDRNDRGDHGRSAEDRGARGRSDRDRNERGDRGRGEEDRGNGRGRGNRGRADDRTPTDPGRSEIELVGTVAGEPTYSQGRKVASLWLSVHTQVQLEGADRDIRGYHPISVWGDLATDLRDEFREGDIVRVHGRIAYEPGEGDRDPQRVRVKVDADFGSIGRIPDDEAKGVQDCNRVYLEGVVHGDPRFSEGRGDKAAYLAFDLETVVEAPDGRQSRACHEVVVWDRAAIEANGFVNDGVRVEITDARLQYMPTRRDGKDFAPRIMADDLAGRVAPAA